MFIIQNDVTVLKALYAPPINPSCPPYPHPTPPPPQLLAVTHLFTFPIVFASSGMSCSYITVHMYFSYLIFQSGCTILHSHQQCESSYCSISALAFDDVNVLDFCCSNRYMRYLLIISFILFKIDLSFYLCVVRVLYVFWVYSTYHQI